MEDSVEKIRKEFSKLLNMANLPKPGTYNIEVAEVLAVGSYYLTEEVAIVKDTAGKVWAIPEDKNYGLPGQRLVSRHDVAKGMKLRLTVKTSGLIKNYRQKEISEVVII
jgi:hypothetical protein